MRRIVDISVPLKAGIVSDPPGLTPEIEFRTHADTAGEVLSFFPGAELDDLPDREGWAVELARITTHNGTHLDAPYHYASTMDGGRRAITIDEVPLEWCMQPAVKLDFRGFADGYVATAADVEAELARIGHELQPLEIVVVNTSAGAKYGQDDYVRSGCGMGREATLHLLERGGGGDRHGRVELGRAVRAHRRALRARARRVDHLGGPPRGARDRLQPHREAAQPRVAARRRVRGRLLPGQRGGRLGGLDAGGRDPAVSENQKRLPSPGAVSRPISPPWRSISLLQIARPRP